MACNSCTCRHRSWWIGTVRCGRHSGCSHADHRHCNRLCASSRASHLGRSGHYRPADHDRGLHEIGPVAISFLAARSHGCGNPGERVPARGNPGEGGRLPSFAVLAAVLRYAGVEPDIDDRRLGHRSVRSLRGVKAARSESTAGVFDGQSTGDHGGAGGCRHIGSPRRRSTSRCGTRIVQSNTVHAGRYRRP